jgi:hypothetical protein
MRGDFSACRSCQQQVRWARSATSGKPMPLDESGVGNVILDGVGKAHAFRDHAAAVAAGEAFPDRFGVVASYFLSHHATCPAGDAWRGQSRERPPAPEALF